MLLYQVAMFSDENHDISVTTKYIKNKEASSVITPEVLDCLEETEKRFSCHLLANKLTSIFTLLAGHEQKPQRSFSSRINCF